jgi:hypothetical protein
MIQADLSNGLKVSMDSMSYHEALGLGHDLDQVFEKRGYVLDFRNDLKKVVVSNGSLGRTGDAWIKDDED